jgi:hypothetical protein
MAAGVLGNCYCLIRTVLRRRGTDQMMYGRRAFMMRCRKCDQYCCIPWVHKAQVERELCCPPCHAAIVQDKARSSAATAFQDTHTGCQEPEGAGGPCSIHSGRGNPSPCTSGRSGCPAGRQQAGHCRMCCSHPPQLLRSRPSCKQLCCCPQAASLTSRCRMVLVY